MIDHTLLDDLTPQARERLLKLARQPLEGERFRETWEPGDPEQALGLLHQVLAVPPDRAAFGHRAGASLLPARRVAEQ